MKSYIFDDEGEVNNTENENQYLPLSYLLNELKSIIEYSFEEPIWIRGEISNIKHQKISGHYYFEIIERDKKGDPIAKVNATCWEKQANYLIPKFEKETEKSISAGIICDFYVKINYNTLYGLSININNIRPSWSVGEHEKKKIKIREEIKKLGIGENQKLKSSPKVLTSIAVLSPSSAAGLGDFISESKRWSNLNIMNVYTYTAMFEGEKTKQDLSKSLASIKQDDEDHFKKTGFHKFDLVIILRGGGSKSSLAFLDELDIIVNMLNLPVPVWTAIGHEEDSVLLDEYACRFFHTPSKSAAEIWNLLTKELDFVTNSSNSIKNTVNLKTEKILNSINNKKESIKINALNKINYLQQKLKHTKEKVALQDPMSILYKGYNVLFNEEGKIIKSENDLINANKLTLKTNYGIYQLDINSIKKIKEQ